MLTVKIDTVLVKNQSLVLGGVVEGPDRSWLRFVVVDVPVTLFDYGTIQDLMEAWDVEREDPADTPALF